MPQCCAVPFCSEKKGGHSFPKDETRLKEWLVAIRRANYTPSKHSRVCKKHFTPDDYVLPKEPTREIPTPMLNKKAVPSQYAWNCASLSRKGMKKKRLRKKEETAPAKFCSNIDQEVKPEVYYIFQEMQRKKGETAPEAFCSNIDQEIKHEVHFAFEETGEEIEIEYSNKDVSVQCSLCKCDVKSLNDTADLPEHEKMRASENVTLVKVEYS